jgi:putative transposase
MAQPAIEAACDARRRDKAIRPVSRPGAASVPDRRVMSLKGVDRASLLTLEGRVVVPFVLGRYCDERLKLPRGRCDLIRREDGKRFLPVTVDVPDGAEVRVTDFLGVDPGIADIAADSDGGVHSGKPVEGIRREHNLRRRRLQRKGTKGAKKELRRVSREGARFRRHEDHCISERLVEAAGRTGRGIAVEDRKGIRDRVTARGTDARDRLSGWSSGQLPMLSWRTRRNRRASRSRPWIPATPVARVPIAAIAGSPTGRAEPSLHARPAATGPMPTGTPPGISGLGPSLSGP